MHCSIRHYWFISVLTVTVIAGCDLPPKGEGSHSEVNAGASRLSRLLRAEPGSDFPQVLQPRIFRFPQDHGPHPEYRNEWWYLTGNLDGRAGERFGFELTLFRFSLTPGRPVQTGSRWRTNQVYIGHFAITDVEGERFEVARRYSRGVMGLAGAALSPFRVWLDDWSIDGTDSGFPWRIRAADAAFALELDLTPLKPVVLNGDRGLSQKSAEPGNASYYYSIPRLKTAGTLRLGDRIVDVSGLSWLDREWGSSALSPDQRGWDWFALQLSDGTDLMFYNLRRLDGSNDEFSSGTLIDAQGDTTQLALKDVQIEVTGFWNSEGGGTYPSGWRLAVPRRDLELTIQPVLKNQELVTNVRYWEGAVDVAGRSGGRDIDGRGYVELTGYADP